MPGFRRQGGFQRSLRSAESSCRSAAASRRLARSSAICAAGTDGPRVLSGESIPDAVAAVRPFRPLAALVNCCPVGVATTAVAELVASADDMPVGAYANGMGVADSETGWRFEPGHGADRAAYVAAARRWIELGARWLGGCCGTTPEYVADLCELTRT